MSETTATGPTANTRLLPSTAYNSSGATLAAIFMKRLGDAPLWPVKDPRLGNSLKLRN
jgi:hypothetical protein